MRAFESVVVGKRFVGASKQAKPKQKLVVVEGSEKKDDNQEFFDAEIRRRPIGSLLPTSRSFASRARGFSRATSFSAPMIKIGNRSSSSLPPSRRWSTENLIFQLLSGTRTPNIG